MLDVIFVAIGLDDLSDFYIQYDDKNLSLIDACKSILKINDKNFIFEINNSIKKYKQCFNVELIENYINTLAVNLKEYNSRIYNIEFILKRNNINEDSLIEYNNLDLILDYNKVKTIFECNFNDMDLCRILILNIPLDFKIFLKGLIIEDNKEETIISKEKYLSKRMFLTKQFRSKEIEIKYDIDKNDLINVNNLRFCIYSNNNHMTIHNMDEKINSFNIKQEINLTQLNELYNEIEKKIKLLIDNLNNNVNLLEFKNQINKELGNYNYNDDEIISLQLMNDDKFTEKELYKTIEYFYKYSICESKNILNILLSNVNQINDLIKANKEIFDKYIKYILEKIIYFKKYVDNIINNKQIENLILPNQQISFKKKSKILSVLLTIIFDAPKFEEGKKIEFFPIDDKGNSVYKNCKDFTFKIIENLTKDSIFGKGLEQLMSRVKEDINKENKKKENVFILEMRNLKEFKNQIKNFYPKLIIRTVNSQSENNANYDILSDNIIINEIIYKKKNINYILGKNNDNKTFDELESIIKGNIVNENDKQKFDLFTFKAFWRINHEGFGHRPVSILNKKKIPTPSKFFINGTYKKSEDAGKILEYYITKEDDDFIELKMLNCDISPLLSFKLYIQNSFHQFWEIVEQLIKKKYDDENQNEKKYEDEEIVYSQENILLLKINEYYNEAINKKSEKNKKRFLFFQSYYKPKNNVREWRRSKV